MRILYVSFGFPPRAQWGTEFYTHQLAEGMRERGYEAAVLHPVRDGSRPRYTLEEVNSDGFRVFLLHNAGDPRKDFADSYRNERVEELFRRVLDEVQPDVVHFTYLLWGLSVRMPMICRERGIPTVITLTDYGLLCHRGQMFDHALKRCLGPHPADVCARCIREPSRYDGAIQEVWARRAAARVLSAVGGLGRVVTAADVLERERVVADVLEAADLFIAPTEVVERVFLGAGVPSHKLVRATYAMREDPFLRARPEPDSDIVRFGFLGQFMPHKGLGTLLDAVRIMIHRLPESVEPWEVLLYGEKSEGRHQRYADEILRPDLTPRVRVLKPFEPFRIAEVLARLHAVVVPSEWDENAPLTVLQARAAGVPVIASDAPGITEIVEDGVHGLTFPMGDAGELANAMREVVLRRVGRNPDPRQPMSYADHMARLVGVYHHLQAQRSAAAHKERAV